MYRLVLGDVVPQYDLVVGEDGLQGAEAVPHFHGVGAAGGLVYEDPRGGRVQHYVEVGPIGGRPEEGARRAQPGTVPIGGLGYSKPGMLRSVYVRRFVSCV